MRATLRWITLAAGIGLAPAAHAQYGFTLRDVNVRAGPDRDFPLVAWLPVGTVVLLGGCIDGWRWCEVRWDDQRGFVYAGFLGYPYEGGYVVVRDAGPYLGLALVPFVLETYWGAWYVTRPWYHHRRAWAAHPMPPPPPWRPPAHPPQVRPMPPSAFVPPLASGVPPITNPVPPLRPPAARPAPSSPPPPAFAPPRPQPR